MEFETPRTESEHTAEMDFLSYDAIEDVRQQQEDAVAAAEMQATHKWLENGRYISGTALTAARQSAEAGFGEQITAFLDQHMSRDENPARYDAASSLLRTHSIDHMDNAQWRNGNRDADGNLDFTTSGRYQLGAAREDIRLIGLEETDNHNENAADVDPIDHSSPEAQIVYRKLIETQTDLAKLSIERRKLIRKNGKVSISLAEQYAEAETAYAAARSETVDMYVHGYRTNTNLSEQQIFEKIAPLLIKFTHHDFTAIEFKLMSSDESLRSRAARFLAKRGALFGLSAASGAAIGFGARTLSKSAIVAAVGISGGVAAGALLAVRTTKNILMAKIKSEALLNKEFDKRRMADESVLARFLNDHPTAENAEQSLKSISARVGQVITDRVETDRKSNFKRMLIAGAIGGAAAALAEVAVEFGPDIMHNIEDKDSTLGSSTPLSPGASNGEVAPNPPVTPSGPVVVQIPDHQITIGSGSAASGEAYSVTDGEGFGKVFQDVADQQGAHNVDGYKEFLKFSKDYAGENIFTDNNSYNYTGGARISHPGLSHFNARFLADYHQQLLDEQKIAA
jgi:hypothetical protein